MSDFTFSCKDAQGDSHRYELQRHRGSEGLAIAPQLLALIVQPLSAALGPVAGAVFEAKGLKGITENPAVLASVDMGAFGKALSSVLQGLPPALMLSILRYTNRDGVPLVAQSGRATEHFDLAYAGNYSEMWSALLEVCRINHFFPGLDSFESVTKLGKAVLAKASQASPAAPSTST